MTPIEAEAARVRGALLTSDLPNLAALWLVQGLDTPALRELAGQPKDDAWGNEALWATAREQLGVRLPASVDDQLTMAVRYQLAMWRAGASGLLDTAQWVVSLWMDADYSESLPEGGNVTGLLDELSGEWGRARPEILADIDSTLLALSERLGPRQE